MHMAEYVNLIPLYYISLATSFKQLTIYEKRKTELVLSIVFFDNHYLPDYVALACPAGKNPR